MVVYRQVNMDYAVSRSLSYNTSKMTKALLLYDIWCQYHIHGPERLKKAKEFISLPKGMKLEGGIGKFHVGAHITECFWKYSPNFMMGVGQVDGEILETLWAILIKAATSTRSMVLFHRFESLDDHIRDSNWKKLVGISE